MIVSQSEARVITEYGINPVNPWKRAFYTHHNIEILAVALIVIMHIT